MAKTRMSAKEMDERTNALMHNILIKPIIMLVGVFVGGAVVDTLVGLQNTFSIIFTAVGGVPAVVLYYRQQWQLFMQSRGHPEGR